MTTPEAPSPDRSPDRITPAKATEPPGSTPSKPAGDFDSYMQSGTGKTAASTPTGPTPMDIETGASLQTGAPTHATILAQSKTTQDALGDVKNKLNTPNLKFKRSQSHLLKNKLQDAHTHMRAASNKLGLEPPPLQMPTNPTPLDRFLAYVNDGQDQMVAVQEKLKEISNSGKPMNPSDLLLVQVKMNQAQQEIEYSSTLLSKVIDSIKTIINIQL